MVMPFRIMPLHLRLPIPVLSTWDLTLADETTRLFPVLGGSDPAGALLAGLEGLSALGLPGLVDIVTVLTEGPTAALLRRTLEPQGRWDIRGARPGRWRICAPRRSRTAPERSIRPRTTAARRRVAGPGGRERLWSGGSGRAFAAGSRRGSAGRGGFPRPAGRRVEGRCVQEGEAYQVTGRAEWLREVTDKFRSRGSSWHWTSAPETGPSTSCSAFAQAAAYAAFRTPTMRLSAPDGLGSAARTGCLNWFAEQGSRPSIRTCSGATPSLPGSTPTVGSSSGCCSRRPARCPRCSSLRCGPRGMRGAAAGAAQRGEPQNHPESAGAGPGDGGP